MKIAIIGAGLAGLAVAYFLIESQKVEITMMGDQDTTQLIYNVRAWEL